MKTNPFDRLKVDDATQKWWQSILDNPQFASVIEAAKYQLEMYPETYAGAEPIQALALTHAAHRGGHAAFDMLNRLGSDAFGEMRAQDGQMQAQRNINPQTAGRRYGSTSQQPPEIAPRNS